MNAKFRWHYISVWSIFYSDLSCTLIVSYYNSCNGVYIHLQCIVVCIKTITGKLIIDNIQLFLLCVLLCTLTYFYLFSECCNLPLGAL